MQNVKVEANVREFGIDDYCRRYSYGDDAKIRSDLDNLISKLTTAVQYDSLEEIGYLARKVGYTAKNVNKLHEHNEMIEFARKAVLDVPKGGYVTRWSVRQLFKNNGYGRYYEKFAYGATIVALEELVADGKLKVVRAGDGVAYKRI